MCNRVPFEYAKEAFGTCSTFESVFDPFDLYEFNVRTDTKDATKASVAEISVLLMIQVRIFVTSEEDNSPELDKAMRQAFFYVSKDSVCRSLMFDAEFPDGDNEAPAEGMHHIIVVPAYHTFLYRLQRQTATEKGVNNCLLKLVYRDYAQVGDGLFQEEGPVAEAIRGELTLNVVQGVHPTKMLRLLQQFDFTLFGEHDTYEEHTYLAYYALLCLCRCETWMPVGVIEEILK